MSRVSTIADDQSDRSRRSKRNSSSRVARNYAFISYSRSLDGGYVHDLAAHLNANAIPTWHDNELAHDERWPRAIPEKVDRCGAFIVVMTPEAEESRWVENEVAGSVPWSGGL
jgi:hypothetical protein